MNFWQRIACHVFKIVPEKFYRVHVECVISGEEKPMLSDILQDAYGNKWRVIGAYPNGVFRLDSVWELRDVKISQELILLCRLMPG